MTNAVRIVALLLLPLIGSTGCRSASESSEAVSPDDPGTPINAERPASPENSEAPGWVELAPGLRVDVAERAVEFEGEVAVDVHHPDTPRVWLELLVTSPNTREHESLVVTAVPPSLIHAALLAAGLEPGSPGRVWFEAGDGLRRRVASGNPVEVAFVVDGIGHDAATWVEHAESGAVLAEAPGWHGLVFAGSSVVTRGGAVVYDADGTGVVIGLTTFGSEVVAPRLTLSPDAATDRPVWIARRTTVPKVGTPVRVIVRGAEP